MYNYPETLIWFGDNNYKEWEDVFSSYNKPTLSLPGLTEAYSYGIAGMYINWCIL
jgi:hypothetical protein